MTGKEFLEKNTHPTSDKYKIIKFLEKWDQNDDDDADWSDLVGELLNAFDSRFVAGYMHSELDNCNDEAEEEDLLKEAIKHYPDTFWDLK